MLFPEEGVVRGGESSEAAFLTSLNIAIEVSFFSLTKIKFVE